MMIYEEIVAIGKEFEELHISRQIYLESLRIAENITKTYVFES